MKIPHISVTTKITLALIALAIVAIVVYALLGKASKSSVEISTESGIDLTATQVEEIKMLGQWEFLSISMEEMVDTVRYGFFGDDELTRIYSGTMRLGVNLKDAPDDWIRQVGADSIAVTLPEVGLIDHDFIDEALTQSFHESGKWTGDDREAMRQRAYQAMLKRGLTESNLRTARENGRAQFTQMLHAIGFEKVSVSYSKE